MSDESQEGEPQEPVEPQKPDEPSKPDEPPRLEERSSFPPPIEPPVKPEPQPGDEPRLPPLRGPEIPGAQISEQGMYRVADSDLDVFETGLVEPFLGLGMDEKPIEWLWPGYVPIGKLTLIEGESASGKSFVAADIAARVSRGQPWPGRVQGPQPAGDVIVLSFEDSRDDTLAPRLRMAGANMNAPETCSLSPRSWTADSCGRSPDSCGRSPDSCGRSPDRATDVDRRSPDAGGDLRSEPSAGSGDPRRTESGDPRRTGAGSGDQCRTGSGDPRTAGCIYFLNEISEYNALRKKGETVRNRKPVFDKDLVHLEHAIRRHGNVRLVVIDALPTLCPDKKAYRQTLRRLEEIARRQEVAILATARPSTRSRGRVQVTGDKLSEEVRCLFNVLRDPEDVPVRRGSPDPAEEADRRSPPASGDLRSSEVARTTAFRGGARDRPQPDGYRPQSQRRFLAPVRMNFTEEPEWLAFRIVNGALAWETPTDGVPLSSCLASPTERKAVVLNETMNWLREMLKDGDQRVSVMKKLAREWGYTEITLRRAREKLEIRTIRHGAGPGSWCTWSTRPRAPGETDEVPDDSPPDTLAVSPAKGRKKKQRLPLPPKLDDAQINGRMKDLMKVLFTNADLGGDGSDLSAGNSPARKRKAKPSSNGDHRSNGRPRKPR